MSSAKKIEANRRNAQKSCGPKSAEGKGRSRFNAIKHGMRAEQVILPGEAPEEFTRRVLDWTDDLKPRNKVEQYLVEQAAAASWRLDRIELAHVARLTDNINNAAADAALGLNRPEGEGENVPKLASRLFWDARGPLSVYPHYPIEGYATGPIVSWSGAVDDLNNPAQVVHSLESTAAGCAWLLDCWAELRSLLEQGQAWRSPDKLKATRLLGRQPVDAFDNPKVGMVFVACHKIDPGGGELFHEIWYELKKDQILHTKKRLNSQPLNLVEPTSKVEARQALFSIVDQAVGRLETLAEAHRKRAEASARLLPARLAFDGSVEGERLRRYETSCSRTLLRTLDSFDKRHRADDDADDGDIDPVVPASVDECPPVSAVAVEPDVEIDPAFAAQSINEPIEQAAPIGDYAIFDTAEPADAGLQSHCEPDATGDNPELPNEPTATVGGHLNPELPNEPTAPISRQYNPELPNEVTAFIRRHLNPELPNEPTALISLQHSGGRKLIDSGTHRRDWDAKPKTGPTRRERKTRRASSQKTEKDLTSLLPPRNHLNRKPP